MNVEKMTQRQRIKALGFSLKGFAEYLSENVPNPPYTISNVTLSRMLHQATGGRSERWLRAEVEKLLRDEERRRAAK